MSEPAPSGTSLASDPSEELDDAIDTLAELLRTYGQSTPVEENAETLKTHCDGWAQHVLVLADPPDAVGPRTPSSKRQWRVLRRSFARMRSQEVTAANEKVGAMRDALWAFVRGVSRVLATDGTTDRQVTMQLGKLRAAVSSPVHDLPREVDEAVGAIESAIRDKQARILSESNELAGRVQKLSGELEDAKREGAIDALTKVSNRKGFDEHLQRVHELAAFGAPTTLLMIDIDHFKSVNDRFGHPAGDKALSSIADTLVKTCRRRRDFVARYGGEEFAIILPDTSCQEGASLAQRARAAVRLLRAVDTTLTVSIGVAQLEKGELLDAWLARADRALYRAKSEGRDRVVLAEVTP